MEQHEVEDKEETTLYKYDSVCNDFWRNKTKGFEFWRAYN